MVRPSDGFCSNKEIATKVYWVIARRKERLGTLQENVRAKIVPMALDLTTASAYEQYKEKLELEAPEVSVLVNASGFGVFKPFSEISLEEQLRMIDLNDKALIVMTYLTVPFMKPGSCIYRFSV